ncbi:MAG: family 1 glycosylhydrolase [Candidatus Dojkabacteria bacterium]
MPQLLVFGRYIKGEFKFPKDFLWGAATSSHQIEGGLTNNWSEWEDSRVSQLPKERFKHTEGVARYYSEIVKNSGII